MNFNFAQPSKILTPYVRKYWGLENVLQDGEQHIQRIIPSGLPELILYLDNVPIIAGKNRSIEDRFSLNGQQNDYYDLVISGHLSIFSILFQPQGLSQFFNLPAGELTNQNVPLKYLNKKLNEDLQAKLMDVNSFEERVIIVENSLIGLLAKNNFDFQRIHQTVELIRKTKGNIEIDLLAANACLSRKQFERKFMEYIGVSPKQFLKTVRFQAAIFIKANNQRMNLTELAYDSGYYDQSHFINEFKTLTGSTPKQFFNEDCDIFSDFFQ